MTTATARPVPVRVTLAAWIAIALLAMASVGVADENVAGASLRQPSRFDAGPEVQSVEAFLQAPPIHSAAQRKTADIPRLQKVPAPIDIVIDEPDSAIILDNAIGNCSDCVGPRGRFWGRGEVLGWWVEGFSTPALVTTSPNGTARQNAGVLGQPGTSVLFGNERLAGDIRLGGRTTIGGWLGDSRRSGVEATFFGLQNSGSNFAATSPGNPILARPFFNVEPGFEGQDAELAAFPGELAGSITVNSQTKLYGLEVLYRHALSQEWPRRVDLIAGWRYAHLEDDLLIRDQKEVLSGNTGLAIGTTLSEFDHFQTKNVFNGAEVGVVYERWWCKWAVEGVMKVALGNTHSEALIDGSTTVSVPVPGGPNDVLVTPAGLLAQQSNIGSRERDEFAVIPELGLNVGYDVTPNLRATVGYTFIYWSRVARPGDQIDTKLNLSQLPPGPLVGIPSPEARWVITDMWVQGISAGIDFRF
ncbi:MAG: BBP7 family outer membrane beta-barrel protein [Planctomycetota bacterium]